MPRPSHPREQYLFERANDGTGRPSLDTVLMFFFKDKQFRIAGNLVGIQRRRHLWLAVIGEVVSRQGTCSRSFGWRPGGGNGNSIDMGTG
jgi:hypothetical protein